MFPSACAGTVEGRICELQEWKRSLVEGIMGSKTHASSFGEKLQPQEMEYLLGIRDRLG